MFERILLAVDGSEYSREAIAAAAEIAAKFGSEVLVVHAREPRLAETGDHLATEREAAELAEWAAEKLRSAHIHARIGVRASRLRGAADTILSVSQEYNPGLIIIGARGHSGLESLLLGSVSRKVIQFANSPVLVVR